MIQELMANSKKPAVVTFTQILIYLNAIVNIGNGIYSLGSEGIVKITLSIAMIILGIAAIWVATRLNTPIASRLRSAIVLSCILIVLRLIEFTVWHSFGLLLGTVLPILVIWRLNSMESKKWFGLY
ncbi:hypothetical protein SAMN03159341_11911 [Paenibacillus sp. 1_12]|uniref:hypothetical protein n=1 Tax=Paenibacillus sp. 1_12 TaxID=1566278 RepID=UPI0008EBADF1|nr:hypothetical protein [Paenibacillus sp. 1_12]SFM16926.1 hypothetical protein SAMN03159341_11911 [Paenibacillus sp. 1_12]